MVDESQEISKADAKFWLGKLTHHLSEPLRNGTTAYANISKLEKLRKPASLHLSASPAVNNGDLLTKNAINKYNQRCNDIKKWAVVAASTDALTKGMEVILNQEDWCLLIVETGQSDSTHSSGKHVVRKERQV